MQIRGGCDLIDSCHQSLIRVWLAAAPFVQDLRPADSACTTDKITVWEVLFFFLISIVSNWYFSFAMQQRWWDFKSYRSILKVLNLNYFQHPLRRKRLLWALPKTDVWNTTQRFAKLPVWCVRCRICWCGVPIGAWPPGLDFAGSGTKLLKRSVSYLLLQ